VLETARTHHDAPHPPASATRPRAALLSRRYGSAIGFVLRARNNVRVQRGVNGPISVGIRLLSTVETLRNLIAQFGA